MSPLPRLSDASDTDLVKSAAKGNREAFDELTRRHRRSVLLAIEHLVHDHDLAEDLTQETLIRAFKKLRRFRLGSRFAPWILKIANRVALDELRKGQRLKKKGIEEIRLEPTPDFSMPRRQAAARPHVSLPSDSTPTRPDPAEVRRAMEEAIAKLKGHQRRCMYLREIEGLSYENIAQQLGLTKGTVSSYVTRGRKQLRDMPGPHQDFLRAP